MYIQYIWYQFYLYDFKYVNYSLIIIMLIKPQILNIGNRKLNLYPKKHLY